jgi:hypothetical protein
MGKQEKRFLGALLLGATAALTITGLTSGGSVEKPAEDAAGTAITAVRVDVSWDTGPRQDWERLISGVGNNFPGSLVVPIRRLSGVHSSLI